MLTQEPQESPAAGRSRPLTRGRIVLLVLAVGVVVALRHDFWNWRKVEPLLGFLPVGLWWQGMVSILAAAMMWLLVRWAWPQHLEDDALAAERRRRGEAP